MTASDSNLESVIRLTSRECRELVDLLFATSMSRKETRDKIVEDLSYSVKSSMLRDFQNAKLDIRRIVDSCLNYPGALYDLIEILQQYEGLSINGEGMGTMQIQAVNRFLQNILAQNPRIIHNEQIEELEEVLSKIDLITLKKIYYESVPIDHLSLDIWHLPRDLDKRASIPIILNTLIKAPTPVDGIPSILRFVERLAQSTPQAHSALSKWVDTAGQDLGISTDTITLLRKELLQLKDSSENVASRKSFARSLLETVSRAKRILYSRESSKLPIELKRDLIDRVAVKETTPQKAFPPYLLIILEPCDGDNRNSFSAKAWLQYGEEEYIYLYASERGEFYDIDTMPVLLNELLYKIACSNKLNDEMKTKLTIEFFLPCKFFNLPVDRWLIDDIDVPLGARNKVVIRSLERIDDITNRPLWITKWHNIQKPTHQVEIETVHWISEYAQCHDLKVYTNLINENIVCLGLTLVPPPVADPCSKREMFHMIFKTGTPIAFWPRYLPEDLEKAQKIQQLIRSLITNSDLINLPNLILTYRREALEGTSEDQKHLGCSLALLLDDPYRLPPDKKVKLAITMKEVNS